MSSDTDPGGGHAGAGGPPTDGRAADGDGDAERVAALEREVERLRAELDRKETELSNVVDRYERVIERREREHDRRVADLRAAAEPGVGRRLRRRVREFF